MLAIATASTLASDVVELSWRRHREWDALRIDKVEIAYTPGLRLDEVSARLKSAGVQQLAGKPVRVTIPIMPDRWRTRLPHFPGVFGAIFEALTRPEREVEYFYDHRKLRRYSILCSSKNTAENPESANYWLDGELLGKWEQARLRFESMEWEDDAVAEFLFDRCDWLTASGVGLYIIPELRALFQKHRMFVNIHFQYRKAEDR